MKTTLTIILIAALTFAGVSCQTSYDAYGNPRQSVDPGVAVAGAAAVGVLGYALANKRNNNRNDYYRGRGNYYNDGYHGHHRHHGCY